MKTEDDIWKQLFLVSRYLSAVRPPLVRVYSGEVAKYIFGNALADMFRPLPSGQPSAASVLAADSLTTFDTIRPLVKDAYLSLLHTSATHNLSGQVGRPVAIRVGPRGSDLWVIAICNFHPGSLKYDPRKETATLRVMQVVERINVKAEAVIVETVKTTGPPPTGDNYRWVIDCRQAVLAGLEESGLMRELDHAVEAYDAIVAALGKLRVVKEPQAKGDVSLLVLGLAADADSAG
jgi:hypothetical protein